MARDNGLNHPSGHLDFMKIAAAQHVCPDTTRAKSSSSLKIESVNYAGMQLLCDVSTRVLRPLIPREFRRQVFLAVHELAHPGIRATRRLLSSRYVWRGMAKDTAAWCRDCQQCQRSKPSKIPKATIQPIHVPQRRFAHIHVDLVGPLPISSQGHSHIFTIVDRSTRWLEAVPMKSTTATACADALVNTWISRFGVPDNLTSDRGAQFTSDVWHVLCSRLGIKHHLTTAFHPQSNGLVERSHLQLKNALRARSAGVEWPDHLPWVLLGLRVAPKEDHNISSAELVYGAPLNLLGEFLSTPEPPPANFTEALRTRTALPT